jgi:hypothetical protein
VVAPGLGIEHKQRGGEALFDDVMIENDDASDGDGGDVKNGCERLTWTNLSPTAAVFQSPRAASPQRSFRAGSGSEPRARRTVT